MEVNISKTETRRQHSIHRLRGAESSKSKLRANSIKLQEQVDLSYFEVYSSTTRYASIARASYSSHLRPKDALFGEWFNVKMWQQ